MTWGNPFRCETWSLPSKDLKIVTHLLCSSGLLRALSKSSMAPLFFFSFLTKASTAFSAHFSSSSPSEKYSEIYDFEYFFKNRGCLFFPLFYTHVSRYNHILIHCIIRLYLFILLFRYNLLSIFVWNSFQRRWLL